MGGEVETRFSDKLKRKEKEFNELMTYTMKVRKRGRKRA